MIQEIGLRNSGRCPTIGYPARSKDAPTSLQQSRRDPKHRAVNLTRPRSRMGWTGRAPAPNDFG